MLQYRPHRVFASDGQLFWDLPNGWRRVNVVFGFFRAPFGGRGSRVVRCLRGSVAPPVGAGRGGGRPPVCDATVPPMPQRRRPVRVTHPPRPSAHYRAVITAVLRLHHDPPGTRPRAAAAWGTTDGATGRGGTGRFRGRGHRAFR
ncbi:hypothetical protein GCM10022416_11790 [Actinomadura keratinilytica]|uniref:Uncharacterized protein n=1 Tax=Actinomadura keratinilytica TaxID=547461 RepID=A0ABP7Y8G6_9ACTN